jgi:hypothetical protein
LITAMADGVVETEKILRPMTSRPKNMLLHVGLAPQRYFAARLKWTVTTEYADAHHAPVVELVHPENVHTFVRPGLTSTLRAKIEDPDGVHVTGYWWYYEEARSYPRAIKASSILKRPESFPSTYTYPIEIPTPGSPMIADQVGTLSFLRFCISFNNSAASGTELYPLRKTRQVQCAFQQAIGSLPTNIRLIP